ncbi:MAG: hypothetical protein ACRD0U_04915 [Acidimicrobiales bacterium]
MPRARSLKERLTDRVLGVSRRRRKFAYAAIGTGLALLRPALNRLVWISAVTMLLAIGAFGALLLS